MSGDLGNFGSYGESLILTIVVGGKAGANVAITKLKTKCALA